MVSDPVLWLSISTVMVAISLVIFLASLLPTIQELNRTVRGADRLIETLNRELPATLEALRSTSKDLNQLADDLGEGVESAKQIVKQVDRGLESTGYQLTQARITSQSAIAGFKTAWNVFFRTTHQNHQQRPSTESMKDRQDMFSSHDAPSSQDSLKLQSIQNQSQSEYQPISSRSDSNRSEERS